MLRISSVEADLYIHKKETGYRCLADYWLSTSAEATCLRA